MMAVRLREGDLGRWGSRCGLARRRGGCALGRQHAQVAPQSQGDAGAAGPSFEGGARGAGMFYAARMRLGAAEIYSGEGVLGGAGSALGGTGR